MYNSPEKLKPLRTTIFERKKKEVANNKIMVYVCLNDQIQF